MIDREHKLSIVRQAKLLGFSRGSVQYLHRPVCYGDLALMRRRDKLHLNYPFGKRPVRPFPTDVAGSTAGVRRSG